MRDGQPSSSRSPASGSTWSSTNPPFVISPATGERLVYRDSGLPGDGVVEHIVRGAPQHLTPRRLAPGAGQLGASARRALGGPARRLARGHRLRRLGGAAGGRSTPRRTSSCGSRTPGVHGARRSTPPLRHLAGVVRGAGRRGGGLRLAQPAPAGDRPAPVRAGGVAVRGRAAARAARSATGRRRADCCAATGDAALLASRLPPGSTCARRPSASPARRTPRRSCSASSAGCAAPGRRTPSRPGWSAPATGT